MIEALATGLYRNGYIIQSKRGSTKTLKYCSADYKCGYRQLQC